MKWFVTMKTKQEILEPRDILVQISFKNVFWIYLQHNHGEGNGNPFQYSCLGNLIDRGAWWAIVNGIATSHTQLSDSACPIITSAAAFTYRFLNFTTDLLIKTPLICNPRILIFNKVSRWLFYT